VPEYTLVTQRQVDQLSQEWTDRSGYHGMIFPNKRAASRAAAHLNTERRGVVRVVSPLSPVSSDGGRVVGVDEIIPAEKMLTPVEYREPPGS
jgi:hypothetical protein